jgi:hypothetical protein
MGTHTGPIRVYDAPRPRWLASLMQPATTIWLGLITWATLAIGGLLIFINIVAPIALAAGVTALWAARWIAMASSRYVLIADRYTWEQVDGACDAIVRHLPNVSALLQSYRCASRPLPYPFSVADPGPGGTARPVPGGGRSHQTAALHERYVWPYPVSSLTIWLML